jgi:hypothetical protein
LSTPGASFTNIASVWEIKPLGCQYTKTKKVSINSFQNVEETWGLSMR